MVRRRKKVICLLVTSLVSTIIFGGFLGRLFHRVSHLCNILESKKYLESMCSNYTNGIVTGSLCKPLCVTMEMELKRCLGHGVKLHVLEVEWNGLRVVLKASKPLGTELASRSVDGLLPLKVSKEEFKLTTAEFIFHAERCIRFHQAIKPGLNTSLQVATNIAKECDIGNDGVFSYHEAIICWQLITNEEYILYSFLQGNSAILDMYGVCGNLYAVQYTAPEPFLGYLSSLSDSRTWEFRSKLAIALLNMAEALEHTPFGTLYLCDVQEANFGVVKRKDGTLVAKAIDVDVALFEHSLLEQLHLERNLTSCTAHQDCSIFSCASKCDTKTGKCSGKLFSSNLVNICRKLLKQRHYLHPALLQNPPSQAKEKIQNILEKCSILGNPHNDRKLLSELRQLLLDTVTLPDDT